MSRSILKSSSQIGILSLISRCVACLREYFLIRFLSIGDTSDIFFSAFRIPNTMRKIFAEGVLSSILVPAFVNAQHKGGNDRASKLTTLSFFIIELFIFLFCILIFFKSQFAISLIVPGFATEKAYQASQLLKILISFILFISSGAIFAAALQAHKKFFIPAIAPGILNIVYIIILLTCWLKGLSIETFCFGMIINSIIYFLIHLIAYFYMGFTIQIPTNETWQDLKIVMLQFVPCCFSSGILEINHFINTRFCSYLSSGSITLIRTSFQFVNIPVGIIAASLSTVLLPHFSKLHIDDSKNISHHVCEAIKFTLWSILPIGFLLYFFSKEIFQILFYGDCQALDKIDLAQKVFLSYLFGLIAFSLNKIFLSIFFALRLSFVPMIATIIAIFINYSLNKILLYSYKAPGIAFASSVSSIFQTIFFLCFLHMYLKMPIHFKDYKKFFINYFAQLIIHAISFFILFKCIAALISKINFSHNIYLFGRKIIELNSNFFTQDIGVWIWAGPLSLLFLWSLYSTRKTFKITLEYFDKE